MIAQVRPTSVSVVISTKNRPDGVMNAVRSVIDSLPEDGEIIIVDDGSIIPARTVLRALADPRLKCVENPGPHGPSAARNFGVCQASSDLILFLDDDDLMVEDYCTRVLARLPELPDACVFGFSTALHLEADGSRSYQKSVSPQGVLGPETPLKHRLAGLGMGFWIKRHAFNDAGKLDIAISVNEDTEFSIRLAANGYSCYCDQTAGVILILDPVRASGDASSITKAAGAKARYEGFEYILTKHRTFLLGHGAFRRKFFSRVLKYRVRAAESDGWYRFWTTQRPLAEAIVFGLLGSTWLWISKLKITRPFRS